MKTTIQAAAAAITLVASSAAHAQEAVQWKVSDGGNGHWYAHAPTTTGFAAEALATSFGGKLASISSSAENEFVRALLVASGREFVMLGLIQADNQPKTNAGWGWVSGEPLGYTNWTDFDGAYGFSAPDDNPCACCEVAEDNQCNQGLMYLDGRWDDVERGPSCAGFASSAIAVIEWSADCNADGIVDYGQCRDGSLADYNGNNIPDCCESGTSCVVGNYPVQWRVEDGGNGHWYQSEGSNGLTFEQARAAARGSGGWVVMPKTLSAVNFVFSRLVNDPALWWSPSGVPRHGPWIGLVQDPKSPEYSEPGGGWRWMDGSVASYFNWADDPCQPQPANCFCGTSTCGLNNAGFYTGGLGAPVTGAGWGAFAADMSGAVGGLIIEWSADCNNDGIVDYGQILQGQLVDTDSNGVPDICEDPCPGDITNGGTVDAADLSILLAAWGTNGQAEFDTDIDGSGLVDGGDLALVLGGWGPCPE